LTGSVDGHRLVAMPSTSARRASGSRPLAASPSLGRAVALAALAIPLLAGCRRSHEPPDTMVPGPPPAKLAPPPAPTVTQRPSPAPAAAPVAAPSAPRAPEEPELTYRHTIDPKSPALPDGGTANGDPHGPRPAAMDAVVKAALPSVQACFDALDSAPGVELVAQVSYRVTQTGRTAAVDVTGSLPGETLKCIRLVIEGLKFPAFEGPPVSGNFPFKYHREPLAQ